MTSTTTSSTRVWFITGTSSGLGKALTETLLEKGDCVIATARSPQSLSYLKDTYPPSQLLLAQVDVTNKDHIDRAFEEGLKVFGNIDVVVNNAGYAVFGEIEGIPEEDARRQFEVQFWGAVNVMKRAAPIFRAANKGTIFNISTIGGYIGNPTLAYYSSSKFALEGFTDAYLKELGYWNVKGTIIEPGGFDSEWRGSSATEIPTHPAYTDPGHPCAKFRQFRTSDFEYIGSAKRMAIALHGLAAKETLPLRIPFGSDAHFLIGSQAKQTLQDIENNEEISRSTDKEGADGKAYVRDVLMAAWSEATN